MDSSSKDSKKTVRERFQLTPTARLLASTKLLIGLVLEPELVTDHKRKEIIEQAGKAILDATAEVN